MNAEITAAIRDLKVGLKDSIQARLDLFTDKTGIPVKDIRVEMSDISTFSQRIFKIADVRVSFGDF